MRGKARIFDPKVFLAQTGLGRTILQYPKDKAFFKQGDPSDAVFYLQKGRARLTVLSTRGREATVAMLGEEDFMGEECIASDQTRRVASAIAIADCYIIYPGLSSAAWSAQTWDLNSLSRCNSKLRIISSKDLPSGAPEGLNRHRHSEQPKPRKRFSSIHTSFLLMAASVAPTSTSVLS